jgi:transcription antitermination factor NusG
MQSALDEGQENPGALMAVAYRGKRFMRIHTHQWPWFGILVRAGGEKTTTLLLENAGYECFSPVSNCKPQWPDQAKGISPPLFPGYVFCRMNPHSRLHVLLTPGVVQIAGIGKNPIPIAEDEIAAIQRAEKSHLPTMPWPYLTIGQVARMEEGPLRGLTGIVVKIKFGFKLVLSVSLLQRSVAVEIDRNWIGANQVRPVTNQVQPSRSAVPSFALSRPESPDREWKL